MTETIYHLHLAGSRDPAAPYQPDSLRSEGFIHFSTAAQVAGSANRYYADHSELLVLEVPVAGLSAELVWENTVGGTEPFPHLYGALQPDEVTRVHRIARGEDGLFRWP